MSEKIQKYSSSKTITRDQVLEEYTKAFHSTKRGGFTQVADIIDDLTYIEMRVGKDGIAEYHRNRLTPLEKDLYRVIFKTCGYKDTCWKTTLTLAEEVNCSTGTIVNSKRILNESFEQLDGHSLIEIEVKSQFTIAADPETGKERIINKRDKHYIKCNHIYNYSKAYMKVKKHLPKLKLGKLSDQEAEVAIEKMRQGQEGLTPHSFVHNWGARSIGENADGANLANERALRGADSTDEAIHIHTPKFHSYDKPNHVRTSAQEMLLKDDEVANNASDVFAWLKMFGVNEKVVNDVLHRFTVNSIAKEINLFIRNQNQIVVKKSWVGVLLDKINRNCCRPCD